MRVDIISKEYPPEIYGGAGVHVAELVAALREHVEVQVRAFGNDRDENATTAYRTPVELADANAAIATLGVDLAMVGDVAGADVVHSHTWYANFAGHLAKLLHGIPHVITAHSLEPLRPWKAEQLGGGYRVSSFIEQTAYESADAIVAVSDGMRRDILRCYPNVDPERVVTIHNGIDLERWVRREDHDVARSLGINPTLPTVIFVGRITRQKGLPYLLRAARQLPADVQLVFCAGAPDTPEIMAEVQGAVEVLRGERDNVVWIDRMLNRDELSTALSVSTVFVCPSVYEPLGIVNLEAMACGVAVVGTATGGIPEVVDDGVTGRLVPIEQTDDGTGTPLDPERFVSDLARVLTEVVTDADLARRYGEAGRRRVEEHFAWSTIADRTEALYRRLTA
jgi:starch synthase